MARGDAAKKAWALYRAKYGTKSSSSRSRTTASGATPRRARRRFLGVLGKAGVTIMAGAPIVGSGISAADKAFNIHKSGASVLGSVQAGFACFLNGLTKGFGMKEYYDKIIVAKADGTGSFLVETRAINVPENVWWGSTFAGGVMFATDRAIAWATKAAVKSPIGGFYLTGR